MRKREAAEICSNLGQIGEACVDVMQVSTSFLDEYVHAPITIPMQVDRARPNVASIELNAGETVTGTLPSVIEELEAYDEALVPMGLGAFASARARSIWYIPSIERSVHGSSNPEKARLTYDVLRAVKALNTIGGVDLPSQNVSEKSVATKTKRLAQTLVSVVVAHPEKLYLPADRFVDETASDAVSLFPVNTYTRTQALGLGQLRPFWQERSMKPYADKAEEIVDSADTLPEIDTEAWVSQLRRERLGIWTPQERQDFSDFLHSATQAAYERAIEAGYTEKDFRLPDPS